MKLYLPRIPISGWLQYLENYIKGYRWEHWALGTQMGVAFLLTILPSLITRVYVELNTNSTIWALVTSVVVLEPSTGSALRKIVLRLAGVAIGGSLGIFVLFISFTLVGVDDEDLPQTAYLAHCTVAWLIAAGVVVQAHRQRYLARYDSFWLLCLYSLPIAVGPSLRDTRHDAYYTAGYRVINIGIGVVATSLVSALVFPVHSRDLLRRSMSVTLIRTGDLAAWLARELADPLSEDSASLAGASKTDAFDRYEDDGLAARFSPLRQAANALASELAGMEEMLTSAANEFYVFAKPHRFPIEQYEVLLRCLHVVVGLYHHLLYLATAGELGPAALARQARAIAEVGAHLSASFTALSGLVAVRGAKGLLQDVKAVLCCGKKGRKRKVEEKSLDDEEISQRVEKEARLRRLKKDPSGGGGGQAPAADGAAADGVAGEDPSPRPFPAPVGPLKPGEEPLPVSQEDLDDPFAGSWHGDLEVGDAIFPDVDLSSSLNGGPLPASREEVEEELGPLPSARGSLRGGRARVTLDAEGMRAVQSAARAFSFAGALSLGRAGERVGGGEASDGEREEGEATERKRMDGEAYEGKTVEGEEAYEGKTVEGEEARGEKRTEAEGLASIARKRADDESNEEKKTDDEASERKRAASASPLASSSFAGESRRRQDLGTLAAPSATSSSPPPLANPRAPSSQPSLRAPLRQSMLRGSAGDSSQRLTLPANLPELLVASAGELEPRARHALRKLGALYAAGHSLQVAVAREQASAASADRALQSLVAVAVCMRGVTRQAAAALTALAPQAGAALRQYLRSVEGGQGVHDGPVVKVA